LLDVSSVLTLSPGDTSNCHANREFSAAGRSAAPEVAIARVAALSGAADASLHVIPRPETCYESEMPLTRAYWQQKHPAVAVVLFPILLVMGERLIKAGGRDNRSSS
jgi:hypothetical protein